MRQLFMALAALCIVLAASTGAGAEEHPVHAMSVSSDGNWAAVAGPKPGVRFLDLTARSPRLHRTMLGDRRVERVAFSPDGTRLALTDQFGWLEVRSFPDGGLVQAWEDLGHGLHELVWRGPSHLERIARLGGITDSFRFDVFLPGMSTPTSLVRRGLAPARRQEVLVPAVSRRGDVRVLVETDRELRPVTASAVRTDGARAPLPCPPEAGRPLALSRNHGVSLTPDGRLCPVDLRDGRQPMVPPALQAETAAFQFLEDGDRLAVVQADGSLWVWNLHSGATTLVGAVDPALPADATMVSVPGERLLRAHGSRLELIELSPRRAAPAGSRTARAGWLTGR